MGFRLNVGTRIRQYIYTTHKHTHLGGVQPAIVEDDTGGRRLTSQKASYKFGSRKL